MLQITIQKTAIGYAAKEGDKTLCVFGYDSARNAWDFRADGLEIKTQEGRAFPWSYFLDFCRVVSFLNSGHLWTSEATAVISGKSYIK